MPFSCSSCCFSVVPIYHGPPQWTELHRTFQLFQLLFFCCSNVPWAPTMDRASLYLSVVQCFSVSVLHQQYVCELLLLVQGKCQQQDFDYQCIMDPHNGQSFTVPFCCPIVIPVVVFLLFQCTMGPPQWTELHPAPYLSVVLVSVLHQQ